MGFFDSILTSELRDVANSDKPIDYLVIGSGTAGVTSALALAAAGNRVVILEAGPFVLPGHVGSTAFGCREEIVPRIHEKVLYRTSWLTSKAHASLEDAPAELNNNAWSLVGGRTVFWGGCTPRFQDWDFGDWPIGLNDLAPYYDRVERMLHVSGGPAENPAFFQSGAQERLIAGLNAAEIPAGPAALGVDTGKVHNGHISRGFDSSVDRLLRSGLLVPFGERTGVSLVAEAEALRMLPDGDRIAGVEVLDRRGGETFTLHAGHVVLAGGAVQSTRLALASELDDPAGLIGRYVNDHLFVQGVMKLPRPLDDGPLYIFLEPTAERPFHVQIQGTFRETWYSPYHATVWLDCHHDGLYMLYYVFGVATMEKENRIECRPAGSRSSMQDYVVVYDRSERDIETLEQMRGIMPRVAGAMGAEIVKDQINPPGAALHEVGGLRMADDPDSGVTDRFGRFWHYTNLSAADASIWPSQGTANSYLTITAVALRVAEKLIEDRASGGRVSAP